MTVPAATALIGVPDGTPMSTPGWNEQSPFDRQRGPYGLVIGPCTGQTKPDAGSAPVPPVEPDARSAALIRASSWALCARSAFASPTNRCSLTWIELSVSRFDER